MSIRSFFNDAASIVSAVVVADAGAYLAANLASSQLMAAGTPVAHAGQPFAAMAIGVYYGARIGYHGAKAVLGEHPVREALPRHLPMASRARL